MNEKDRVASKNLVKNKGYKTKKISSFFDFLSKKSFFKLRKSTEPKEFIYISKIPITHKNKIKTSEVGDYKEVALPLYFGLELVMRHRKGWQKRVMKPFHTYWQYITVVVVLIVLVSTTIFINQYTFTAAATYNFTQTDWSGGATANTATHSTDQDGWTEYTSKDSNISAGTEIVLTESLNTVTETSDTDFDAGATSTASVVGSGDSAYVELDQNELGSNGTLTGFTAYNVIVDGNYAYMSAGTGGMKIVDISTPTSPSLAASHPSAGGSIVDIAISSDGNYAYLAGSDTEVVNITTKTAPSSVSTLTTSGTDTSVEVAGDVLYVFTGNSCGSYCYNSMIRSYDISTPSSPSLLDSVTELYYIEHGIVSGDWAYAIGGTEDGEEMSSFDISDPSNMLSGDGLVISGSSYLQDILVYGDYKYIPQLTIGVRIVSGTDPLAYVDLYNTTGSAYGADVAGSTLYVADFSNGVVSLDLTDPEAPTLNDTYAVNSGARNVDYRSGYLYVADNSSGLTVIPVPSYVSSGTFTSQIIDTGGTNTFGNASWTSTEPTGTGVTMKVRSDSNSDMSGATAWASCDAITSGNDISANNCVTDGHQYIQYQATLTSDGTATPQLSDISIQYNAYSNGSILSSAFDSESSGNVMGSIQWTESGSGEVQFQIRTAPDSAGSPDWASGSGWCGPSNCAATTGDTDYAASYHTTSAGSNVHSSQNTGDDDQWFQYRLWLTSADGSSTPTVSDVVVVYVVNAPPDFESAPTASQDSSGIVYINYSVRDVDTEEVGAALPLEVQPSFQYSLDNGVNWNNITNGLSTNATSTSANATSTKTVAASAYNQYTAAWTPNELINQYTTTALIKVIVDDNEGANNVASSTSAAFTMDAKLPVAGSPGIQVIATTSPATLNLSATDDTALDMCISLDQELANCLSYNTYSTASTIELDGNPDTVYVHFRDAYNNITTDSATTPVTPANMIIRDLSNTSDGVSTPEYRLFVSWGVVTDPAVGFGNYEVWHSTDGVTYSLIKTISDRTINYFLHEEDDPIAPFAGDSMHYYKVYTVDADGNTSGFSSVVSDVANGQGGTDASPPTISSVSIDSITTQSATITWNTDELSDSTIGYSTDPGDFNTTVGVASMVTSHSVTMSGLTPGDTYYLSVTSNDPDNNPAVDTYLGDGYYFTTLSGPAISNVSASTVQNNSATITWNTDIAAGSTVYYSTNSDLSDPMNEGDATEVLEHSVTISELTEGTKYYYYVTSGVASDNNAGEYHTFNTTSDGTGPVITDVDEAIITDDDAVIIWTTDEGATSQVYYGLVEGVYPSSTVATSVYTTSHSVTVSSLENSKVYYYAVTSVDSAGNRATSTDYTFTTYEALSTETEVAERIDDARAGVICSGGGGGGSVDSTPPKISNIAVAATDEGPVGITWDTDEFAISFVYYGIDDIEENVVANPASVSELTRSHSVVLTNLLPETSYKYKVVSVDSYANVGESEESTFSSTSFLNNIGDGTGDGVATEESFLNSVEQATIFFQRMSTQVSLNTLEAGIITHIDDLGNIVPPPIISGEPVVTVSSNSVAIEWVTSEETNALVTYASEREYVDNANVYSHTIGDPDLYLAGIHRVNILGLDPETTYHYKVVSEKEAGSRAESKDFVFTTIPEAAEIENYTADILSTEEANFKWVTTVPTDSQIRYTPYRDGQLAGAEARIEKDDGYTTIHDLTVENFEAGVLYQVDIFGQTPEGRLVSQTITSFATSDDNLAPSINQVRTESALSIGKQTKVQTIISWETNELSTAKVYYQQGSVKSGDDFTQSTPTNDIYAKHHVVVITDFAPGAIYSFQVENTDTEGNSSRSRTYTILTPKQTESVFQVIMRNVEDTFGWLKF